MARPKEEFFKAEKCVKCENKDCKNIIYLNTDFKEKHIFSDVYCPKYKTKPKQ